MKRKYPTSFFVIGIMQNLVKYVFISLIGALFLIIGFLGTDMCITIGIIILICYFLLCVIEQFIIRSAILKESNSPEFNEFMDGAFGVNNQDENTLSSHQKIINIVEEKIKSQSSNRKD
jgi:hypothetical protein